MYNHLIDRRSSMEEEKKRENSLEKLLESRGGFIEITEAIELLGPTEYTKCLVELIELEEGNPHDTQLFYKNGDSEKPEGQPTHICFSSAAMEWFSEKVDAALEAIGALSPRTKGLTKH